MSHELLDDSTTNEILRMLRVTTICSLTAACIIQLDKSLRNDLNSEPSTGRTSKAPSLETYQTLVAAFARLARNVETQLRGVLAAIHIFRSMSKSGILVNLYYSCIK